MKIRALSDVHVPGVPALVADEVRELPDDLAAALVERGQASEVKPEKAIPAKKNEDKQAK